MTWLIAIAAIWIVCDVLVVACFVAATLEERRSVKSQWQDAVRRAALARGSAR